jgi:hypothetical protein
MNNKYHITAILGAILVATIIMGAPLAATAAKPGTSGVHFQGPAPQLTCTANSCSFTTFTLAGLGQGTGTATLDVTATFKTQCTNPGGNVAPGQDATTTATSGPQPFSTTSGGKATVQGQTVTVTAPTSATITCPNSSWTGSVVGQPTLSATLTVTFNGITIYTQSV